MLNPSGGNIPLFLDNYIFPPFSQQMLIQGRKVEYGKDVTSSMYESKIWKIKNINMPPRQVQVVFMLLLFSFFVSFVQSSFLIHTQIWAKLLISLSKGYTIPFTQCDSIRIGQKKAFEDHSINACQDYFITYFDNLTG